MRTTNLSQIGFGYFSCNLWNDQKEKYPLFTKNTFSFHLFHFIYLFLQSLADTINI